MRIFTTPSVRHRLSACLRICLSLCGFFVYCSLLLALSGSLLSLSAQSLSIFFDSASTANNARNFPRMQASVRAFDAQGLPITSGLNFQLTEDGVRRTVSNYFCPELKATPVSAVLTIDISGSMGLPFNGTNRLKIAQQAATAFVDALAADGSECGIVAFETNSYPFQNFTANKDRLKQVIGGLSPLFGTNYQAAFLGDPGGAIAMLKTAKNSNRAIIFLTDGLSTARQEDVIRDAKQVGATVYCITIGFPVPPVLEEIARATGGQSFSNVQSSAEAEQIYRELANRIRLNIPCLVEWTSDLPCRSESRSVVLTAAGLSASVRYIPPVSLESQVAILPRAVAMGSAPVGQPTQRTVSVQLNAGAQDLVIRRIRSNDNAFRVLEQNVTLLAGQAPRMLTVQYTAQDEGYRFATLTVETENGCTFDFYATAGFPGIRPATPTLRLTHPNGGEAFLVGTDTVITWTGLPPTEDVRLDYSIDAGKTWTLVDNDAKNLRRTWRVPNTPSDNCLMRVQQKNTSGAAFFGDSAVVLHSILGHKGNVQSAQFDQIGSAIVSAGEDGNSFVWYGQNRVGELFSSYFHGAIKRMRYATYNSRGDIIFGGENTSPNVGSIFAPLLPLPPMNIPVQGMSLSAFGNAAIRHIQANPVNPNRILITTESPLGGINIHDMSLPTADNRKFITVMPLSDGSLVNSARYTPRFGAQNQLSGIVGVISGVSDGVRLWIFSGDERNFVTTQPIRWSSPFRAVYADATSDPNSPGNLRIAVACTDNRVRFLTITGNGNLALEQDMTIGEIVHQAPITMLSFDPSGNFLVTVSGNQAFIWQLGQSSQLITVLNSPLKRLHKANINTAFFSPDGTKVVTASQDTDTNVVVWFVKEKLPLQEDRSDALWRIVRPHLVAENINMGEAILGGDKDSTHIALKNPDPYAIPITRVWFKNPNSPFSIVSSAAPFTVSASGQHNIEFRFHPLVMGGGAANTDSVFYQTISGDIVGAEIFGVGIMQNIQVSTTLIDWRERFTGIGYDTVQAVVYNRGAVPYTLPLPTVIGGNGNAVFPIFRVLGFSQGTGTQPSSAPVTLRAGDSLRIALVFTPPAVEPYSALLQFNINQPGTSANVQLLGIGIQAGPRLASTITALPAVQAGGTCDQQMITIKLPNTGTEALIISSISIVGTDGATSSAFKIITQPTAPIPNNGGIDSVRILFMPQTIGTAYATLLIRSNSISGDVSVPLQGRLERPVLNIPQPQLVVTQPVDAGQTTTASIRITNSGNIESSWYPMPSLTQRQYFRFISEPPSITLSSHATANLRFTFLGGLAGMTYQDTIRIINDCVKEEVIVLSATVNSAPRLASSIQSVVLPTCASSATINIPITNTGTAPARVSYAIEPPTRLVSRLVTTGTIGTGETFMVQVILDTLARAGTLPPFSLVIREASTASISVPISITKHDAVNIDLIPPTVAFPVLEAGVATSAIVIIRNRTSQPLTIPAQALNGTPQFRLEVPSQTLPPYGEVAARLIFTGAAAGLSFADSFPFRVEIAGVNGCATTNTLSVGASTLPPSVADLVFRINSASPGDTTHLQVFLQNRVRVPIGTEINDILHYNVSLLQPLPPLPTGDVEYGERIVPLRFVVTSDDPLVPLARLPFRAALGNDTATVMRLRGTPETRAAKMTINASTATFRLVGISRAGGLRLVISSMGTLRILDARPNPASTELTVDFTSRDAEEYTLYLINALGVRPDPAAFPEQRFTSVKGINTRTLDVSRLPSGMYFLQLRNGRELAARKIMIMR